MDFVYKGVILDVFIYGEVINVFFYLILSISFEGMFESIEVCVNVFCVVVFFGIVFIGRMFGGLFWGLILLVVVISLGIFFWVKDFIK